MNAVGRSRVGANRPGPRNFARLEKAYKIRNEIRAEPLVLDGLLPDGCPELAELILSIGGPSAGSTNVGGWKSDDRLFEYDSPAIIALDQAVTEMLGAPSVAWAMVNHNGSLHRRHQHGGAIVSWVYYVEAGDPLAPTIFECADGSEVDIEPQPGRIAVFPGQMWHRMPAYPGQAPRITIAGDVRR